MSSRILFVFFALLCVALPFSHSSAQRRTRRPSAARPRTTMPTATPTPQETATPAAEATPTAEQTPPTTEQPAPSPRENDTAAPASPETPVSQSSEPVSATPASSPTSDAAREEFARLSQLPPAERVAQLETLARNRDTATSGRARELLVGARASLGDERLAAGDRAAGVKQFRRAVADAPKPIPERLFIEVIARFPMNLYLRGESAAAFVLARDIEKLAGESATRLLALAAFHLGVENADDAARLASAAAKLAPEDATPYLVLGGAERVRLRLTEAVAAYRRALELAPESAAARRSLADMLRATEQPAEALALYRAQLERDPLDALSRTGVVLSLFDAGQRADAERELGTSFKVNSASESAPQPPSLALLVGAAYWYATQGEGARALALAEQAVQQEPRYTWAQIALARALLLERRPAEAEIALRTARLYGNFPTLTYELASVLAASGLYTEAAEELARDFSIKSDGQLATKLAARLDARAADFTELLAPERRAAILQPRAASTPPEADRLRRLFAFHKSFDAASQTLPDALLERATAFAEGGDEMRFFRHLYAADRLLSQGARMKPVAERLLTLIEAATASLDVALDVPAASTATLADDLHDMRRRAIAQGAPPPHAPTAERRVLSNILRGRVEIAAGRALMLADRAEEAATRFERAASILPPNTEWQRTAFYHLAGALEAQGKQEDALTAYLRSHDSQRPNRVRLLLIEALYRRINGSLEGLDRRLREAK